MRILYFTDTHIRGTTPRSRTDDFLATLREKIEEVIEIADKEQVDYVLHGGDVFDRPNLSPAVVREFAALFRKLNVPIYTIAGNHDIYGHNPQTIDRTMLGLLDAFGTVRLLHEGDRVKLHQNGITVQLSGMPFHYDLDKRDVALDYQVKNEMNADYCIHMVHGMLVERALPESVPHTLVHETWCEDVDVLLTGHYHAGFPIQERAGKYVVNPGALARINNHPSEMKRMPQVAVLQFNNEININFIRLQKAKTGADILDRSYLEKAAYQEERLAEFIQQVRSGTDFEEIDIREIILQISGAENVEEEVRMEAMRRIAVEQEKEEASSN
ncbi:metallophosphoesterase family protein [Hazenella sp. IB182357]|uniref:Metallophosphoesterase family protein n=1 Tax=Polycladospora coralii TaxID=2771432 RepID=A0A926RUZ0_9BACL|nr:metallophosphoesterase [Polycladospora coralii]MBD1373187.1 metallophosphoesterase family protein [Polycladospora coralii]